MQEREKWLNRLMGRLDMPCEALPHSNGITVFGQYELHVRGCRRILRYAPEEMRFSLGKTVLVVWGRELVCTSFALGDVTVTGCIEGVRWEG